MSVTPPAIEPPYGAPSDPPRGGDEFLGHPGGLFLLFAVEMWERFSYYGMRALLVLYLISVIAVHQLPKGAYSNVLEIKEKGPAESKEPAAVQTRTLQVLVGGADSPATADEVKGQPGLKVVRLIEQPDPSDATKTVWVPDTNDAPGAPLVTRGEEGAKGKFSGSEHRLRIYNESEKPIEAEFAIRREGAEPRTYFSVNDNVESVTATIKPDSQRGADEKPFEVRLAINGHDSGRNWTNESASTLYGWYTGLAYLFPILGGIIADKLIGTHRSMLVGGLLISIGHIILGISGMSGLAQNATGMSLFIMGLAVIVLGTGHFKPTVSVMVGQLYKAGDPRRDGAFTIFYMGINLGAFLCAFVCGTLGEKVGWHWGFGSAAVGMILGLLLYMAFKPVLLKGIGDAPRGGAGAVSALCLVGSLVVAAGFAYLYHVGSIAALQEVMAKIQANRPLAIALIVGGLALILGWVGWFLSINRPEDRGPVLTIFVFMFFNAFFWIAFEQAGSSVNVFTEQNTDRMLGTFEVPATWFQSVNAGLIFMLAPLFAFIWTALGRKKLDPSQPAKIALGLIFLGIGYIFMVWAGKIAVGGAAKAGMWLILMTYFWHTVGELCLSPTGLSYVTKAAPAKFVSLLMGIWFVSSFIANLGGGLVASAVQDIEKGVIKLPWNFGGQADFFFLFIVTSVGAGLVILVLTPFLKKLMRPGT
ncbi:MAG: peptide MFS transporter [Planctomycetes bacterium]|nr:peptide MFS transporter [Planctomycetota bacterium]